jgi:hypothetical protein
MKVWSEALLIWVKVVDELDSFSDDPAAAFE